MKLIDAIKLEAENFAKAMSNMGVTAQQAADSIKAAGEAVAKLDKAAANIYPEPTPEQQAAVKALDEKAGFKTHTHGKIGVAADHPKLPIDVTQEDIDANPAHYKKLLPTAIDWIDPGHDIAPKKNIDPGHDITPKKDIDPGHDASKQNWVMSSAEPIKGVAMMMSTGPYEAEDENYGISPVAFSYATTSPGTSYHATPKPDIDGMSEDDLNELIRKAKNKLADGFEVVDSDNDRDIDL